MNIREEVVKFREEIGTLICLNAVFSGFEAVFLFSLLSAYVIKHPFIDALMLTAFLSVPFLSIIAGIEIAGGVDHYAWNESCREASRG